jgi:hypothetical protein
VYAYTPDNGSRYSKSVENGMDEGEMKL